MFFLIGCGLLYFLPSIVAHRKHAFTGVFLVNLLLGWTVIGWFVALIWACTAEDCRPFYAVAAPMQGPARYCPRCGALSQGVGSFCWNCGSHV
jgi:hypothetical protein